MHEAAVIAALVLAEHAALAVHRDHLAVHARRILDTSSDGPNRRVGRALEVWGHTPPGPEPLREELWDQGPHVMAEAISNLPSGRYVHAE